MNGPMECLGGWNTSTNLGTRNRSLEDQRKKGKPVGISFLCLQNRRLTQYRARL